LATWLANNSRAFKWLPHASPVVVHVMLVIVVMVVVIVMVVVLMEIVVVVF